MRTSLFIYEYPLLKPLTRVENCRRSLASLEDLSAMNLSALVGRGSRKDFLDIYPIGIKSIRLEGMLSLYARKFGVSDTAHLFLCAFLF